MLGITKNSFKLVSLFIAYLVLTQSGQASPSPAKIKKQLFSIYQTHQQTFFCEEPFSAKGELYYHGCEHCPPIKMQIKWMPIVPLDQLAKNLHCYHEKICLDKKGRPFKGIRCCQQSSAYFQRMKTDLHNLVPELSKLAQERQHKHFGVIAESKTQNRGCHFYIDHQNKVIDPSPRIRGMIARTYLYMKTKYSIFIDADELALYLQWHQQYSVTQWEQERNHKIQQYQGNSNSYAT